MRRAAAVQMVQGRRRGGVGGQVHHQPLIVVGREFERLVCQAQLPHHRVHQPQHPVHERQPGQRRHPAGERLARRHGQLVGERGHRAVGPERSLLQRGDLLVGDVLPVREHRAGPRIGEHEPRQARRIHRPIAVEQPGRPGERLVCRRVRQDLAQSVEQHDRRR
ncbi:hypothetical protein GCM10010532_013470 [Dactylosporangium siamense]|uniref:Uncharacterized protein n=1 Tax=Dactylosporangium siamense TaxID=685454 RepID=A0A919U4L4_9ACTN|nr:hypothetical protein Dsi01nite_002900 [Dactylosporangium siamense]